MNNRSAELEQQRVREIAEEYTTRGYRVIRDPRPGQLPDFLAPYHPDLVAFGPDEKVVVEVKSRASLVRSSHLKELAGTIDKHRGWRFELVVANPNGEVPFVESPSLEREEIVAKLVEVEDLVRSEHPEAALLLTWGITEATLRLLASNEEVPLKSQDPPYLLKQLATQGVVSRDDYEVLLLALKRRNAVAHGFRIQEIDPDFVANLAATTRRLLDSVPDTMPV